MKLLKLAILFTLCGCAQDPAWMVRFPHTYIGQDAGEFFEALDQKQGIQLVYIAESAEGKTYIFEEWHGGRGYWRSVSVKDGRVVAYAF